MHSHFTLWMLKGLSTLCPTIFCLEYFWRIDILLACCSHVKQQEIVKDRDRSKRGKMLTKTRYLSETHCGIRRAKMALLEAENMSHHGELWQSFFLLWKSILSAHEQKFINDEAIAGVFFCEQGLSWQWNHSCCILFKATRHGVPLLLQDELKLIS